MTTTETLKIKDLKPSPYKREGHEDVAELAKSIEEVGLLQPPIVRPMKKGYEVCAGTRRFLACKKLKMDEIDCIVRDLNDDDAASIALTENLQRADLTPWEESQMVGELLGRFDAKTVADMQGKTLSWVYSRARLSLLTPSWKESAADPESPVSQWPAAHLLEIAKLAPESQDYLFERTHIREFYTKEELISFVAANTHLLNLAPWDIADAALDAEAGACVDCPMRSSRNPGLFDEGEPVEAEDRCLNDRCWTRKGMAFAELRVSQLRETDPNVVMVRDKNDWGGKAPEGALSGYSYEEVEPGTKGAIKAVMVGDSSRAGQTIHIKDLRHSNEGGPKKKREKGVPTPLAERKVQLKRRRIKRACELVVVELERMEVPEDCDLLILAAGVGTHSNNDAGNGWEGVDENGKFRPDPWSQVARYGHEKLGAYLWSRILPVLRHRLRYNGAQQDMKVLWKDAVAMGKFLKIDTDAILKEATAKIPTPKSWKNLNADGTKKEKTK